MTAVCELRVVFLVGASGVGKTAVTEVLATRSPWKGAVSHFDDIGVPLPEEMERRFGSGESWQEWATRQWVSDLVERPGPYQLLEAQTRPSFINAALAPHRHVHPTIVLLDCRADVRASRLSRPPRHRPELVTPRMEQWAAYLRGQADALGLPVIDTSDRSLEEVAACVEEVALG